MRDGDIPVRDIQLGDASNEVRSIVLWREQAMDDVPVGATVTISHLRGAESAQYGLKFHSTQHSVIEVSMPEHKGIYVGEWQIVVLNIFQLSVKKC